MTKNSIPPPYGPPPAAPPSYAQAVGGVSPTSPFIVVDACKLFEQMSILYIDLFNYSPSRP